MRYEENYNSEKAFLKYQVPFDDKKENKNSSTLGSNCEEPGEFQIFTITVNCEKYLII